MANYLNQEILCEAYTHFDIETYPTEAEQAKIKNELKNFFEERAKFLFGGDVSVTVDFEEGSLKTYLKVLGNSALVAATLLSNYGSIRQGIDTVAKDSTMLAQSGVLEIAFRTKTAFCDSVSVERRRGVYGKASDLMRDLDIIRATISTTSIPEKASELKEFSKRVDDLVAWDLKVDKLYGKLESDTTKACIAAGLLEELEKIPDQALWADSLNGRSFRLQALRGNTELFTKLGAVAGGMQKAVEVVKKKMISRVQIYAPQKA